MAGPELWPGRPARGQWSITAVQLNPKLLLVVDRAEQPEYPPGRRLRAVLGPLRSGILRNVSSHMPGIYLTYHDACHMTIRRI
jgi:hypothetical protein